MTIDSYSFTKRFDGVWIDVAENLSGVSHVHLERQDLITVIALLRSVEQRTGLRKSRCKWRQWRGRSGRRWGTKTDEKVRHVRYHVCPQTGPQRVSRYSSQDQKGQRQQESPWNSAQ